MFDMGPYYLTCMVNLAGAVDAVMAYTRITFPQRLITSEPLRGTLVDVEVPTHIAGLMKFRNGAIGTLTTTFDVYDDHQACVEVFGSRGSLIVPDPNCFGGPVRLLRGAGQHYEEVPVVYGYPENSRGLGVADFCEALREGRPARADCAQTFHVLDLMCAFHDAADAKAQHRMGSDYRRGPALEMGKTF